MYIFNLRFGWQLGLLSAKKNGLPIKLEVFNSQHSFYGLTSPKLNMNSLKGQINVCKSKENQIEWFGKKKLYGSWPPIDKITSYVLRKGKTTTCLHSLDLQTSTTVQWHPHHPITIHSLYYDGYFNSVKPKKLHYCYYDCLHMPFIFINSVFNLISVSPGLKHPYFL